MTDRPRDRGNPADGRGVDPWRVGLGLAALVGAGFVGAAAATWRGDVGAGAAPAAGALGDGSTVALESLAAELAEERRARNELTEEVAHLREEVFELGLMANLEGPDRGRRGGAARPDRDAEGPEPTVKVPVAGRDGLAAALDAERPWFDEAVLASLGLSDGEIEQLRQRWSEHQLEKMNLSDRATREGWRHKIRFRKEIRAIESALVSELGPDRYDLMLYATNQPNRVIVLDVLDGSAAGRAGLQSGDRITGYAGAPVFRRSELVNEIAEGKPGERVRVQVEREGRTMSFDVPRGPLGIRLRAARVPPSEG
jgi:hypothetical protein